ncbi:DUF3658 domain-containing protein [Bradyrhizobium australiense]|uniref:DUF3658 domain-containing protein n=1 Tax=Bradyrhizobium australiense TaxID=2721161 RepID=A0A7Y4LYU7_9BRAD|nr:hypothetical protein [Bradyrhizobium australiense]
MKLDSELLEAIFKRFPEAQVDQIILSVVAPRWHKMARMICDAVQQGQERGFGVTDEMFAARIQALVEAGRLEHQADVRKWRHSEVRLKGGGTATRPN